MEYKYIWYLISTTACNVDRNNKIIVNEKQVTSNTQFKKVHIMNTILLKS